MVDKVTPIDLFSTSKKSKKVSPKFKSDIEPTDEEETEQQLQEVHNEQSKTASKGARFVFRRSSDKRGHSSLKTVRLPPWILGLVFRRVEDRRTPYRDASEFIRDAIWWHLEWWTEKLIDADMKSHLNKVRLSEELDQQDEDEVRFENDMERIRKRIAKFVSLTQHNELNKFIGMIRVEVLATKQSEYIGRVFKGINKMLVDQGLNPKKYGLE